MSSKMDEDLVRQLEEDFSYASTQLRSQGRIEPTALRTIAGGLTRKWLVERNLARIFQGSKAVIELPALDTEAHRRIIDADGRFDYYTAGGPGIGNIQLNSIYAHRDDLPENSGGRLPHTFYRQYRLGSFLDRPCSYFDSNWFYNRDIIKYVANKMGGVHYDTKREKVLFEKMDRAAKALRIGGRAPSDFEPGEEVFIQLPIDMMDNWSFWHVEIISIADALLRFKINAESVGVRDYEAGRISYEGRIKTLLAE